MFENVEELSEASIHLPLRLAVYEKALVNFTKNNGPAALLLYSKARAIYFNDFDDDVVACSRNWFQSVFGIAQDGQFPFTTQSKSCVWSDESENRIVNEVKQALTSTPNNAMLNSFANEDCLRASITVAFNYLIEQLQHGLLSEDVDLFTQIKLLNSEHNLFNDLDLELQKLSGVHIQPEIVHNLITKTPIR